MTHAYRKPLIVRQGKYGRQYLHRIEYRHAGGEDDGWRGVCRLWGYDAEHAEQRFYESPDGDCWEIVTIERAREAA